MIFLHLWATVAHMRDWSMMPVQRRDPVLGMDGHVVVAQLASGALLLTAVQPDRRSAHTGLDTRPRGQPLPSLCLVLCWAHPPHALGHHSPMNPSRFPALGSYHPPV